jgi:tetratricopeptide (TPR) repeat protein
MFTSVALGQNISAEDYALAMRLHKKYPAIVEIRQIMITSLEMRGDWNGIEPLLLEIPVTERNREDQMRLAKVYLKQGRNEDAAALIGPLADAAPADVGLNNLAGQAWFNLGDQGRAAAAFDRVWPGLVSAKLKDAVIARGLIYFYQGAHSAAIETLKVALGMDADSIAANNALARVHAAMGDTQQATVYQQRAEQAHAKATADEARAMRLVGLSHDLQAAWAEKRYGDCVQAAQQMIPLAQPAIQATAYEYLVQCFQAQGKSSEAQEAQAQLARLRS